MFGTIHWRPSPISPKTRTQEPKRPTLENRLACPLPVFKEGSQTLVGQGMLHEAAKNSWGHRRHIGTGERSIAHVRRMADRRRQDLGGKAIGVVDVADLANERHAVMAGIVQAPDKG